MDYPKSLTDVYLHDGKFTDGTADGAIEPSRDPAKWANDITDEVLEVITDVGLVADEADTTQLRQAIDAKIAAAIGGLSVKQKSLIATAQTFAPGVANGDPVRWDAGNTRWAKALADGTANDLGLGIADVTNAEVVLYGETRAGLVVGLTPGAAYYLSATGTLVTTPAADAIKVGVAKSATILYVDFDPGIAPQTANLVFAGPASGSPATPTFRALTTADLPSNLMDTTARDQIALTNLRQILNTGVSTGALVQGRQWELATDEWGATSTNETYTSGSPNYYGNPGIIITNSAAAEWNGATGTYTFSGSNIASNAYPGNSIRTNLSYVGDVAMQMSSYSGSDYPHNDIYFYPTASDGSFTSSNADFAGLGALAGMFGVEFGSTTGWSATYAKASQGTGSYVWGDIFKLAREGTAVKLYKNGAVVFTFSQTSSGAIRFACSTPHNAGAIDIRNVSWTYGGGVLNMTLLPPAAVSLSASPTYADLYILYKDDSGTAVLGTDLTAELSRDGATWTVATLTVLASFDGTYSVVRARASLAAQPVGTTLTCRIKTLNTKAQRVAAPALYAE